MDDVSASTPEQASVAQLDRMKPIEGKLTWIPIGSTLPPPPEDAHLAFWNPCDGISLGYWDAEEGFMDGDPFIRTRANGQPGFEHSGPIGKLCGGYTHYAVLGGPADPTSDISRNWELYGAAYKPPSRVRLEAVGRLEAATGLDFLVCLKALQDSDRDESRALAALKAGGAK